MRTVHLAGVEAHIVFDLDEVRVSAGGTRFAPDVTERETALLARAMTYKFAVLERRLGGAKGAVRGDPARKDELMAGYCAEIKPMVDDFTFLTGPDLGTSEADFMSLRNPDEPPHVMASVTGGIAFEDLLAGFGVVAAAEAATGGIANLRVAIEGMGKVGGGVAREVVRRGAQVVAVSTLEGAVANPHGLDVELMLELRKAHGDAFVHHVGCDVKPRAALFASEADIVVPGARAGAITKEVAGTVTARHVVPAANVPYTVEGLEVLKHRRVVALADFVCNSAAVLGYMYQADATPGEVFRDVDERISRLVEASAVDPRGPYEGACEIAESYLRTWREPDGMPAGRPLA